MTFSSAIARCERLLELPATPELARAWASAEGQGTDSALAAAMGLVQSLLLVRPDLARRAADHLVDSLATESTGAERGQLMRLRGHALRVVGFLEAADDAYAEAWDLFAKHAPQELGKTAIGWVQLLGLRGEPDAAIELAAEARPHLPRGDALAPARLQTNVANALVHAGRYVEAGRQFHSAHRRFLKAGARVEASFCANGLARVALHQGKLDRARPLFSEAATVLGEAGLETMRLYAEAGLVTADLYAGEWEEGLRRLATLRGDFEKLEDRRAGAELRREAATLLAGIGAAEAARKEARKALDLSEELGSENDGARLSFLLGRLDADLGRHQDAVVHLQRAHDRWQQQGSERRSLRARMELARVALATGQLEGVGRILASLQKRFDTENQAADAATCRSLRGELALQRGRFADASRLYREARRKSSRHPARLQRPQMALGLARAEAARGDTSAALRWARRSVEELESQLLRFGTRPLREMTAGARDRVYPGAVDLVLAHGGSSAERSALDLLSRARSPRLIEDLLQGSRGRQPESLRQAMRQLRDRLLGAGSEDEGLRSAAAIDLHRLEERIDDGLRRTPGVLRRALALRRFEAWRERLGDRTLVFFHAGERDWSAFLVEPGAGVRHVALPGVDRMLKRAWPALRLLLETAAHAPSERRDAFLARSGDEAERTLREIHSAVFEALRLPDTPLVLVPDGDLHALPLEAALLVAAPTPSHSLVSRLPHPALLRRQRKRRRRPDALLLRGPEAGPAREVGALAERLRGEGFAVEVGDRRASLESRRSPVGVLHVAAHGSFHREGWLLSGLRLADGWAGFEHLDARWVRGSLLFFASCESGLAGRVPGSDLEGWLTAGLGAGAREMVLTLWKVDDAATEAYCNPFYDNWLEGENAAVAALRARRAMREAGEHAYRWAPFFAVG